MPFKSEKQRRYLWANEPEIARDWADTYGSKIKKADGGAIAGGNQIGERRGNRTGFRNPHEETSKAGNKPGYDPAPNRGSDHGHSRFDVGSGYYAAKAPTKPKEEPKRDGWIDSGISYLKNKQKEAMTSYFDRNKARYENKLRDIYNIEEDEELENYMSIDPLQFAKGKYANQIEKNINKVQEANILNKAIESGEFTQDDFTARLNRLNPPADDRGGGLPYIYPYETASVPIEEEEIVETDPINLYAGSYRVRPEYLLAEGGRVPAAYGGIMDTYTGRRKYGFGSFISKPFKAAKKAVKKLTSSPIGKLALLYAAGTYLGGTQFMSGKAGGVGPGGWASFTQRLKDPKLLANLIKTDQWGTAGKAVENLGKVDVGFQKALEKKAAQNTPWFKNPWVTIPAASAVTGLLTAQQPEEDLDSVQGDYDDELAKWEEILAPYKGKYRVKNEYLVAEGGRIGKQEGGLMDLGGMEKDYRNDGGFVPIGGQEKADDVPARLSRNEFVFTADAVRSAGGGDIDKGAEVMENVMKNLEAGGKVSEESQGKGGAQEMFEVSERLSEVM